MGKRSVVPFGPQHPVLPEPIHLDLVLEDEKVLAAVPSIGYVHRGLESLVTKKDFQEMAYVAERICGICSFGHGMGYCMTIFCGLDCWLTDLDLSLCLCSRGESVKESLICLKSQQVDV